MNRISPRLSRPSLIAAALLVAVAVFSSACSGYGTSPTTSGQYSLTIRNNTNTAFDIYMNNSMDLIGFRAFGGQVPGNSQVTIDQLVTSASYTFRLSPVGAGAQGFLYERQVSSTSSDVTWVVP